MENRKGAVTKIAKTLFSLFSNEVRFKGVGARPVGELAAEPTEEVHFPGCKAVVWFFMFYFSY